LAITAPASLWLNRAKNKTMTSKAQDRSKQSTSSNHWSMLVRHPLLLKAMTWLSSLTLMANASVSWAEIKPIEVTPQTVNAALFQSLENAATTPVNDSIVTNSESSSKYKKLHNDLLGADNFTVAVQQNHTSLRRTYRSQPGILTANKSIDKNTVQDNERQLVSSLVSNVQPQIRQVSYRPDVAPKLLPLPEIAKIATPVRPRFASQPRTQPQQLIRVEKPQALASWTVPTTITEIPNSVPLYVAPPQSNVIPQLAEMPKVSRPATPKISPLPTVQVAQVSSIAPTSLAMSNYSVNSDFVFPLATPTPVSSPYGWRIHPITGNRRFHAGQDLAAPSGAPVIAVANGRVVVANWHGGYGKAIIIEHNGRLQTLYGHLSEIFVQEGQEIKQGTVIGQVGSTGASTGPHLHFETKLPTVEGWVTVDPGEDLRYALNNLEQSMRLASSPQ
jgi:murein DD-endopeptidase MepM/ murein hydrolase activator NlpD